MNALAGALPGGDALKEAGKKAAEDQVAAAAPAYLTPLFPCCGGPVGTVEKFIFTVPADQQDSVKTAIEKYKSL